MDGTEETEASPMAMMLARLGHETHDDLELAQGTTLGRYVVLGYLGAGGMGVVYAAYDPELDRKVALKLLRPTLDVDVEARGRLQREAQAMAQLQHPNVVAVHDVGTFGEQVWVAMEFVVGVTLRQWLRARPRAWDELLAVMLAAGRGLAAANRNGLVHRDVKPDNIMVGDDGRVRVMDFGLARDSRGRARIAADEAAVLRGRPGADALRQPLTREGAVLGTPAYMAPEQFAGGEVDARVDQFSWCVTLWEGLFGERPYPAAALGELLLAMSRRPRRPESPGQAPGWLRKALEKGLQAEPARRYATMDALLADLERAQSAARRRRLGVWFGAGLVGLAAVIGPGWRALAERSESCSKGQEQLVGAWDETRRAALTAAFAGSPLVYAQDVLERLEPELDAYTERWASAYTALCLAHREGEISAELLDQRMGCLRTRRGELRALVDVLTEGSAKAVENATKAGGALVPVERCAVDGVLQVRVPPPTKDQEEAAQSLRESLAAVKAEFDAGLYDRGLERATAAVTTARTLGYEPLLAEALYRQGLLFEQTGRFAEAEAALIDAMALADANALDDLRSEIGPTLVFVAGIRQGRREQGEQMLPMVRGALRRGGGDRLAEQRMLVVESYLLVAAGRPEQARERLASALTLAEAMAVPWSRIATINQLGVIALALEQFDEAQGHFEAALALTRSELGPKHPALIPFNNNLAGAFTGQKRFDAAERVLTETLAIAEASLGPTHQMVANLLDTRGIVYAERGEYGRAIAEYERALAILVSTLGSEHAALMPSLVDLLDSQLKRGTIDEARAVARRALGIWERNGRATAVDEYLARHLLRLVTAGRVFTDREEVRRYLDACFTIAEAMGERGLANLSRSLTARGVGELADGQRERGEASLREAKAVLSEADATVDAMDMARARFDLARALWSFGDRALALEQARAAESSLGSATIPDKVVQEELAAWLAQKEPGGRLSSDRGRP